jgi:hypothetical protein
VKSAEEKTGTGGWVGVGVEVAVGLALSVVEAVGVIVGVPVLVGVTLGVGLPSPVGEGLGERSGVGVEVSPVGVGVAVEGAEIGPMYDSRRDSKLSK